MAARVSYAARTVVSVDVKKKKPWEQHNPLHNRWHPDIPCIAEVACGELFRLEMLDCTGGQIADNDSAEDVRRSDFHIMRPFSHIFLSIFVMLHSFVIVLMRSILMEALMLTLS
ncbi:hypothetical protein KP509_14G080800 [Ceratopteris richardii]|uniref:Uncharacterized protein n=1 Tax=Ceratopteris richardii TaxID=49495 RepID=A0A8T2TEP0_CERRI|nr:hypothetical protein KP509_14G080800 [Ceratopteris richardii]